MMFLPTLGFLLISWFAAWFFSSDDSRRLYSSLISLGGVIFVVSFLGCFYDYGSLG